MLAIIGGFVFCFGCSLLSFSLFFFYFFIFNNCFSILIISFFLSCFHFFSFLLPSFLSFSLSPFLSFFLPFSLSFLLRCVADRILVLWPSVRPESLRWDSWIQDICPPETSQPHVISNGKSSPRDLHLNVKTQLHSMTSKLECWTPYAKQLARQEHKPTH